MYNFARPTLSCIHWPLARYAACLLMLLTLNGCAALAVSLAGAGAGAGLSHQINGAATRTFSEPIDKVDNAVRLATRKMLLEVDEVASIETGQVTRARVGDLEITLKLENLSPNLTRVNVVARKDFFRVDNATAQEIVTQIERALLGGRATRAEAPGSPYSDARFTPTDTTTPTRPPTSNKRKSSI